MKRVLVTGATGFIGRQALAPLLARGYEVHAVSSKSTHSSEQISWHHANLLDPEATRCLLEDTRPTHLLHFAWYAIPGKYWTAAENLDWVAASLVLLRQFASIGGKRAVFAGSCAEYDWNHAVCSETSTPLSPATLYGVSKHSLQLVFSRFARETGISSAWGRIFSLYGPHEYTSRLVASVITSLLSGQPAQCSAGTQIRDYLHVADVGSAFAALLESPIEGAVNIASGTGISLQDLVGRIGQTLGRPELVQFGARPTPPGEPEQLVATTNRLRQEVGWTPAHDLEQGILDTVSYWRHALATGTAHR